MATMHDGALSLGRWHRLVPRGGAGLSCDRDGVALGPIALIHRIGAVNDATRYVVRPPAEVARALGLAYRDMSEAELGRCLAGVGRIAKALDRGECALAAIMAVHLRLPEIAATGMAKLAAAAELHKYSPRSTACAGRQSRRWPMDERGRNRWCRARASNRRRACAFAAGQAQHMALS